MATVSDEARDTIHRELAALQARVKVLENDLATMRTQRNAAREAEAEACRLLNGYARELAQLRGEA